jgi:hypothetical protein
VAHAVGVNCSVLGGWRVLLQIGPDTISRGAQLLQKINGVPTAKHCSPGRRHGLSMVSVHLPVLSAFRNLLRGACGSFVDEPGTGFIPFIYDYR